MPLELGFLEALRGGATGVREAIDFRTAEAIRQADINRALQEERDRDERRAAQRQAEMTANQKFQEKLLREELKHKDRDTVDSAVAAAGPQILNRYLNNTGKTVEQLTRSDAAVITSMSAKREEKKRQIEGLKKTGIEIGAPISSVPRGPGYRRRLEATVAEESQRQRKAQEDLLKQQQDRLSNPPPTPKDPVEQFIEMQKNIATANADLMTQLQSPRVVANPAAAATIQAQIDGNNATLRFFAERANIGASGPAPDNPTVTTPDMKVLVADAVELLTTRGDNSETRNLILAGSEAEAPGSGDHVLSQALEELGRGQSQGPGLIERIGSTLFQPGPGPYPRLRMPRLSPAGPFAPGFQQPDPEEAAVAELLKRGGASGDFSGGASGSF